MLENRKVIIDDELLIADSGSGPAAASAACTVDAVAKVIDTGGGFTEGRLVVDISAINTGGTTASCSLVNLVLQGSATSTFTTYVRLALLGIGDVMKAESRVSGGNTAATISATRYIVPFCNDFGGTVYRWLRLYTSKNGTIDTTKGATFKAWLTKK